MGCAPVPLWGVFSAGLVGGWWLFLGCVDDLEVGNWVWENQFEPELFLRPMPLAFDFSIKSCLISWERLMTSFLNGKEKDSAYLMNRGI